MNQTGTSWLGQVMESIGSCLTPEVAGRIAGLRAPEEFQDRLETLAGAATRAS